jgi:hypothetical protein
MADSATATALAPSASSKIHITVNQKVTLDTLNALMGRISNLTGCLACGLLGIDLRITGDPVEAKQFQMPGVISARFE